RAHHDTRGQPTFRWQPRAVARSRAVVPTRYSRFLLCEQCGGRVPLSSMVPPLENAEGLMVCHVECEKGHPFHFSTERADNKLVQRPGREQWRCDWAGGERARSQTR